VWWGRWTPADRAAARTTFSQMDSGSGFVTDVRQACAARSAYRQAVLRSVPCPTLVTASRQDGGVAFTHAEDFARTISDSRLAETGAPSHLFWVGASRRTVSDLVRSFLTE
jgi:pimeloyl-ACP methyl ester carboxylesterase